MTSTQYLKLAVLALGIIVVFTAISSGGYQQTQSLLIDDNETANATFSSGGIGIIGGEVVYDGQTVCVGNTDCGDVESPDAARAPPDGDSVSPALDVVHRHFAQGTAGR